MADKPKIEVFSAGSAICQDAIEAVKRDAGSSWEVIVHDIKDMQVVRRAKLLGIRFVPAVVIDGKLRSVPLTGGSIWTY
jgi:glutaredoxin 3